MHPRVCLITTYLLLVASFVAILHLPLGGVVLVSHLGPSLCRSLVFLHGGKQKNKNIQTKQQRAKEASEVKANIRNN